MSVDRSGLHVFVSEQFLDSADIVSILEKMGCKGVTERMRGNGLIYFREFSGLFDRFLETRFVDVVAPLNTTEGIYREVAVMSCLDLFEMKTQRLEQYVRDYGDWVMSL
jgi:hypothetical protein